MAWPHLLNNMKLIVKKFYGMYVLNHIDFTLAMAKYLGVKTYNIIIYYV